jgi:RNA polymerase sigma factor (sigma-70 family)
MTHDDEYNITLYLSGDEAGLHALIRFYTKPVYNFVRHMVRTADDAEDITQETFIKVWKYIKKYKQGQGFKTWLFTTSYGNRDNKY